MNEEMIDLSRRVILCTNWRWMPGMRTADAMRVIHDETLFPGRPCAIREGSWIDTAPPRPLRDALPDLTDGATLGCLLQIVRDAYGDPEAHLVLGGGGWVLMSGESRVANVVYSKKASNTESEALVAALEAANE